MTLLKPFCALLCASVSVFAVETKFWQETYMADFERGNLTNLSLSSNGRLSLAPAVKQIYDPSVTFLWAIAADSKGNIYAGGGGLGGAKSTLFEDSKKLAELDGMSIQSIAIDRNDKVYAATSPDGKIYRVDATGKVETFYDPKQKYIWAMAFSKSGDLFVATGDNGEIHRVSPNGTGSVFFKTDDAHARSIAFDPNGNLIVGTDPGGLILRVSTSGQGFVLYQSPKREITSVAIARDGSIYAAAVGNKGATPAPPAPAAPAPAPAQQPQGGLVLSAAPRAEPARPPAAGPAVITGGSEVYHIQSDGYPRKVWSHATDIVYAIAFDAQGRPILGTGNHGAIYRLDSPESYTRLVNVAPTQVTGFETSNGRIYAVTGNIGAIFSIGPDLETSGNYESDVFDAGAFTYWGRLSNEGSGAVTFETRSGNLNRPEQNWSAWEKLNAGRVASPSARFLQFRATLTTAAGLDEVDIAYLMKNVAPVVEEVESTPLNYKFPTPTPGLSPSTTLNLPPLGKNRPQPSAPTPPTDSGTTPAMTFSKGIIGARWLAADDNGDTLEFKLEIRGVNETTWKLIKDKIHEHYYSWDSTAYPDGKYIVRVTASDAPSNPPEQALAGSLQSDAFLIDNSPPEITGLQGTAAGSKIEVRFHAKDALSDIGKAEFSINGGEWCQVDPVTRLSDSKEEDYRLTVDRTPGETTVAVRVADEFENQSVAKVVVR
jgi:sugar lactone lactonase YvrE